VGGRARGAGQRKGAIGGTRAAHRSTPSDPAARWRVHKPSMIQAQEEYGKVGAIRTRSRVAMTKSRHDCALAAHRRPPSE